MKQRPQSTSFGTKTTFVEVWRWGQELERLHARIAPHFVRPEPRRRALTFLRGTVSATERKNGWQLAEHAGESRPDGMQRLLNSAVWDVDLVRDDLRAYILERLGDPGAVVIIDAHEFPQARHQVCRRRDATLWHHWAGGELPGRRLFGLRHIQRMHPARPRIVSPHALDRRS